MFRKTMAVLMCAAVMILTFSFGAAAEDFMPELSRELINLYPGQRFRLTLTDNRYDHTFISSDTAIAAIDADGMIYAKGIGVTDVVCRLSKGTELKCTVNVKSGQSPSEVRLGSQVLTLKKGDSVSLSAEILPKTEEPYIAFFSSDESVAEVDGQGNITAKKAGSTVITVESESTAVASSCFVRVLEYDESQKFSAELSGVLYNASGDKLANTRLGLSKSVGEKMVITDSEGRFYFGKTENGAYVLTAYSVNGTDEGISSAITVGAGNIRLSCILTDDALSVLYGSNNTTAGELRELKLSRLHIELESGGYYDIAYSCVPSDISGSLVSFRSADPSVAEVDDSGRITAFNEGSTTVTASSADGSVSAKMTVTVKRSGMGIFGITVIVMLVFIIVLIITVYIYLRGKNDKQGGSSIDNEIKLSQEDTDDNV